MPLSVETRRLGDIVVVKCGGRIVEGPETAALKQTVDDILVRWSHVVLDVGDVQFVDSAGLGLLVRLVTRAQRANGGLKLCAISPRFAEVLRATRLERVLEAHPNEADALSAFYQPPKTGSAGYALKSDILCVDPSEDVVAYVRELLGQAGYSVITATNVSDALTLLKATRPKLLVASAKIRTKRDTDSAMVFNTLASQTPIVEIPEGFSSLEAGEAGRLLLAQVQALRHGEGGSARAQ